MNERNSKDPALADRTLGDPAPEDLAAYFRSGESWAQDRQTSHASALRTAWICAGVLGFVAFAEAIAIATMVPLKTVEPYTLLVDKQTGAVQALKPIEREMIAPDKALTRSFLAQYVLAREGFDIDSLRDDYRKVTLWSSGEARDRYVAQMQAANPESPLARLPRHTTITSEVRGLSSLGPNTALIRFVTIRTDPGGQPQPPMPWQAVVTWRFSGEALSAADRLLNPLGFQVTRYRRDAEIPLSDTPEGAATSSAVPPAGQVGASPSVGAGVAAPGLVGGRP